MADGRWSENVHDARKRHDLNFDLDHTLVLRYRRTLLGKVRCHGAGRSLRTKLSDLARRLH